MKWTKLHNYCIETKGYRISKAFTPKPKYTLWKLQGDGWEMVVTVDSVEAAKRAI